MRKLTVTGIGITALPTIASADESSSDDPTEVEVVKDTIQYTYTVFTNQGERYVCRVSKETGSTYIRRVGAKQTVQVKESDKTIRTAERTVSVESATKGIEIIKRSTGYWHRSFEPCQEDCNGHDVVGASAEFNEDLSNATKGAVAAAFMSRIVASKVAGTLGEVTNIEIIKGAITAVGLGRIEGNTFSQATVDWDLSGFWGTQKMKYYGYALGPWKPHSNAVIATLTLPGHYSVFC